MNREFSESTFFFHEFEPFPPFTDRKRLIILSFIKYARIFEFASFQTADSWDTHGWFVFTKLQ